MSVDGHGLRRRGTFLVLMVLFLIQSSSPAMRPPDSKEQPPALSAKERTEVVERVGSLIALNYIFPEKGEEMRKFLAKQLEEGKYEESVVPRELARKLTEDLRSVSNDRHLRVVYDPQQVERMKARMGRSAEEREKERQRAQEDERRGNYGFRKLEILEGNIGYLDLRGFSGLRDAGHTASAALNFLANTDAVIIDLRQNGGGSPFTIQVICSYFLRDATHINSFERRNSDTMQQFWTLPYVPGKTLFDTDLYVLTSGRTFSAAEEFTYDVKSLKRATIIGETTGGGAHPGGYRIVNDGFLVWVATGRAVNPITKTNWEGTGIEPHISVPQEKALERAHEVALEKLLENAADEDEARKFSLKWALDGLNARNNPFDVDEETMKKYVGKYGELEVTLEKGALHLTAGGRKFKMAAVSKTYFVVEGSDTARVEFVRDEGGERGGGYSITAHLRSGQREYYERNKNP